MPPGTAATRPSSTDGELPHRLIEDDTRSRRKVETARGVIGHGNGERAVRIGIEKGFREAFRLAPEDQKIAVLKRDVPVTALGFRREIPEPCIWKSALQLGECIPDSDFHVGPIVEPGSTQRFIIDGKA